MPTTKTATGRRVRVFQRKVGWRFAYDQLIDGRWETVQERELGSQWGYDECVKRARVYAELVGATLRIPKAPVGVDLQHTIDGREEPVQAPQKPREPETQMALTFGDTPNRGQLVIG